MPRLIALLAAGLLFFLPSHAQSAGAGEAKPVEGVVYSYIKNGERHYKSTPPSDGTEFRAIKYRYMEDPRWAPVYSDTSVSVSADRFNAKRVGPVVSLWTRWSHTQPKPLPGPKSGRTFSSELRFEEYNCVARTARNDDLVLYDTAGAVVASASSGYTAWKRMIPETVGEAIWTRICAPDAPWNHTHQTLGD